MSTCCSCQPQHQPGAGQQHQRQRDLRRDEQLARRALQRPPRLAPRAFAHRRVHIAARQLQRREKADDDPRGHRDDRCEQQDRAIEPDVRRARYAGAAQPREPRHRRIREAETGRRAGNRERHALGEQLPDQPRAIGAQRGAHGQLAPAHRALREQQIRKVRARDQQHERDGAAEEQQDRPGVFDDRVLQRQDDTVWSVLSRGYSRSRRAAIAISSARPASTV